MRATWLEVNNWYRAHVNSGPCQLVNLSISEILIPGFMTSDRSQVDIQGKMKIVISNIYVSTLYPDTIGTTSILSPMSTTTPVSVLKFKIN